MYKAISVFIMLAFGSVSACEFGTDSLMAQVATDLQLRLSVSADENAGGNLVFVVTFKNVANKDLALNLGVARGGVQYPTEISLQLTDSRGRSSTLFLPGPEKSVPGTNTIGRLDDYVLPLPAGSTYSLELSLARFVGPPFQDPRVPTIGPITGPPKLVPGQYQVRAYFTGRGAHYFNISEANHPRIELWRGTLQSPKTEFRIK